MLTVFLRLMSLVPSTSRRMQVEIHKEHGQISEIKPAEHIRNVKHHKKCEIYGSGVKTNGGRSLVFLTVKSDSLIKINLNAIFVD